MAELMMYGMETPIVEVKRRFIMVAESIIHVDKDVVRVYFVHTEQHYLHTAFSISQSDASIRELGRSQQLIHFWAIGFNKFRTKDSLIGSNPQFAYQNSHCLGFLGIGRNHVVVVVCLAVYITIAKFNVIGFGKIIIEPCVELVHFLLLSIENTFTGNIIIFTARRHQRHHYQKTQY